jgi:ubiquitin carboxyl-terminal hydrolase 25/28
MPETSKPWTVSALCENCRLHVEVTVDSSHPSLFESSPCPDSENPTHFFQYVPSRSRPVEGENVATERWEDVRVFTCASERCPTTVTVTTRPPVIHQQFLRLLTDQETLKRRAMVFSKQEASEVEVTPYKVLKTLHSYCRNAKNRDQRAIPRENPRFRSLLSDDCRAIMEKAHFREVMQCITGSSDSC